MISKHRRLSTVILSSIVLGGTLLFGGCASHTPSPPPPVVKTTPAQGKRAAVLRTARTLIGAPYKWGGYTPQMGFDCSGFIWFVYHQHGINLPRVSWQQFGAGKAVAYDALRPGDLLFYRVDKKGKSLHVAILTDRGTFIHAPSSGKRVMESSLNNTYWHKHYIGARRIL
ncbi:NLP/P60 protein [Pseudodesulfovibrio profundus]|uniref:NLP/P60 protein n=1 Tax=Pseudodesulfovibrio profundus TaxID=57320 RepID=A0A2C8F7E3_9BACT|nr:C40 family peptidase [Pseudodesulfovibrio profundus]SOB58315.1 NLP/P60 protein [Pseudodesulfovibrio profundus]